MKPESSLQIAESLGEGPNPRSILHQRHAMSKTDLPQSLIESIAGFVAGVASVITRHLPLLYLTHLEALDIHRSPT